MPSLAPVVANHSSPVRAAGLYRSWFALGFAIPTFVRTNNKAHQYAPSVPNGKTAARFRRRCAGRYCALVTLAR